MTPEQRRLRLLWKGRIARRCEDMGILFYFDNAAREMTLYDLPDWQIQEFTGSMDHQIEKPKRSLFARILKKSELLESVFTVGEKIGFSAVVVYFGSAISLRNYNMLEKRLFSICSSTSTLANYLSKRNILESNINDFYEILAQASRERELNSKKI